MKLDSIIKAFPDMLKRTYVNTDLALLRVATLDINAAMTRGDLKLLEFVEELERSGNRVRHRDIVMDNGSFSYFKNAIAEAKPKTKRRDEDIL